MPDANHDDGVPLDSRWLISFVVARLFYNGRWNYPERQGSKEYYHNSSSQFDIRLAFLYHLRFSCRCLVFRTQCSGLCFVFSLSPYGVHASFGIFQVFYFEVRVRYLGGYLHISIFRMQQYSWRGRFRVMVCAIKLISGIYQVVYTGSWYLVIRYVIVWKYLRTIKLHTGMAYASLHARYAENVSNIFPLMWMIKRSSLFRPYVQ